MQRDDQLIVSLALLRNVTHHQSNQMMHQARLLELEINLQLSGYLTTTSNAAIERLRKYASSDSPANNQEAAKKSLDMLRWKGLLDQSSPRPLMN